VWLKIIDIGEGTAHLIAIFIVEIELHLNVAEDQDRVGLSWEGGGEEVKSSRPPFFGQFQKAEKKGDRHL
jgi:hypothetical protein